MSTKPESTIQDNADLFKSLFYENSSVMLLIDSSTGDIRDANNAASQYYGWSHAELCGKNISEINTLSQESIFEELENAAKEIRNHFHFKHRLASGEIRDVEIFSSSNRSGDSKILLSIIHDITTQKQAEEALRRNESRFRSFIEQAPVAIGVWKLEGTCLYANQKFLETLGMKSVGEIIGRPATDFFAPQFREESMERTRRRMQGLPVPPEYETVALRADGSCFPAYLSVAPIQLSDKTVSISFITDITERKKIHESLMDSEEQFRAIFENSKDAIGISKDGIAVMANPAYLEMFGHASKNEIIGKSILEQISPQEHDKIRGYIKTRYADPGAPKCYETKGRRKNGTEFPFELNVGVFTLHGEKFSVGIIRDISERKQTVEILKEAEFFARSTLDGLSAHIAIIDESGVIIAVNKSWREFSDKNPPVRGNVSEGANYLKICDEAGAEAPEAAEFARAIRSIQNGTADYMAIEYACHSPDEQRWFIGRVTRFPSTGAVRVIVAHENITQRKHAEVLLKESRDRLELASKSAGLGIWDWDIVNNTMVWDDQMYRLYGVDKNYSCSGIELWQKGLHPDDYSYAWEECRAALRGDKEYSIEFRVRHPDGAIRWIKADGTVIRDDHGKAARMLGINKDITAWRTTEEALKLSEAKFSILFHMNPSACGLTESETRKYIDVNDAFCHLLGFSRNEVIGKTAFELEILTPEASESILCKTDKNGEVSGTEADLKTKSGEIKHVLLSANNIVLKDTNYRFTVVHDISERKKAEESLRNMQKLESLGVLAGGIAHDFNNLLGGIYGYIDLAGEGANDEKFSHYRSKAMATIERARGLTLQLLTFAQGGAPVKKVGNLFPFVRETAQFALSGSNVSCKFEIQPDLLRCDFDKNQIGQVIDNIVINAKQAMPDGGTIELSAQNVSFAENEHLPLKRGDYIKISIKDTGIGIPKNILPRIFDPFYTTKATGHGLGLASCYSIINRHSGCIDVESEPGTGSTFRVYLPASRDVVAYAHKKPSKKHCGSGTFLVMDDEEVMQETIHDMLELLGYSVVCKKNGTEAIDFVNSENKVKKEIAGMLFDLTVPGSMGGKEAAAEIRKTNPTTPIFVTSGYAKDPVMANPGNYGFTASICKPFRKIELSNLLNKHMQSIK